MIKDDNKYVQVKFTKDEDAELVKRAKKLHLSKSAYIGLIITTILSYEGGKLAGDLIGSLILGDDGGKNE